MTPQELKNSILQRAIQGKLVDQRAEEGSGEELYQQIQAGKQMLIKAGKIKKEKLLPEITDNELPFDLPDNWKWVRIAHLVSVLNGDRGKNYPAKSALSTRGIPFISALNLDGKSVVDDDNLLRMSAEQYERLGNGKLVRDDIVVCIRGSLGKHGRYPFDKGAIASSLVILRQFIKDETTAQFLMMYLDTPLFYAEIRKHDNGTAQPNLAAKSLEQFLFPLPPLAEQKRIVSKFEELLPLIDHYEQAWSRLEDFNKRFPVDMQKSILQMAIQGKLVEQRPEEGTGEELYRQIQAEKQALIKAGKIKKEKPLSGITEDDIPFDIPESWKWVRVGWLAVVQSSKRVFEKDYVSEGIPFFRSKEIGDLYRNEPIKTELFITEEHYQALAEGYGVPQVGDILITSVGTIGNTWICDGRKFYYKDGNITQICSSPYFDSQYVEYFLHSPLFEKQALSTVAGTAYSALTIIKLKNLIIPLPPLAEQKRIVAKLEEILPLCERLK